MMHIKDIYLYYTSMAIVASAFVVNLYTSLPYIDYYHGSYLIGFVVRELAYLIGFITLALFRHGGPHQCLFIGSLVYSAFYFTQGWSILFEGYQYYEDQLPAFVEGILMMTVSILIIFNVATYIRRLSNSTSMIFYALIAALALEVVMLLTSYRTFRDLYLLLRIYWDSIPNYALCIFLLFVVNMKGVKSQTVLFDIRRGFSKIEASVFYQGLTVERSVIEKIANLDGSNLWCDRYEFVMNSFETGDYKAVMVKDGDRTHVTISGKDDMTGMNGYRFDLRGVVLDTGDIYTCDTVRLYDEDGYFVQLIVAEEYIDKNGKKTVRERLDLDSIV